MTDALTPDPPSLLVARWAARVSATSTRQPRALDVASGRGRNVEGLLEAGFAVTAVDVRCDALRDTAARVRRMDRRFHAVCADLTTFPLPAARFELVVATRFLQRGLFAALQETLVPGGVIVYETFTELQLRHARGPRSSSHLLRPGELRTLLRDLEILFDEEVTAPDAVARIVARRRA